MHTSRILVQILEKEKRFLFFCFKRFHVYIATPYFEDDEDSRPVVSRTRTYLNDRGFLKPPEGREMPVTDTSSVTRIS